MGVYPEADGGRPNHTTPAQRLGIQGDRRASSLIVWLCLTRTPYCLLHAVAALSLAPLQGRHVGSQYLTGNATR